MTDDSKKLTVSFGAFSCTLDGYDDPMPMLSQVLEQFQAMAKEDPDFARAVATSAPEAEAAADTAAPEAAPGDFDIADSADSAEADWETAYTVAADDAAPETASFFAATDPAQDGDAATQTDWDAGILQAVDGAPEAAEPSEAFLKHLADVSGDVAAAQTEAPAEEPAQEPEETDTAESATDPEVISAEEAAIERMISVSRDRSDREPELAPANPLARLREQTLALTPSNAAPLAVQEPPAEPTPDQAAEGPAPLRLDTPMQPAASEPETPVSLDVPTSNFPSMDASAPAPISPEEQAFMAALQTDAPPAPEPMRLDPEPAAPEGTGILRLVPAAITPAPEPAPEPAASAPQEPDFSDLRRFAASMGAESLSESMEAAAAYITLIDGQKQFSRREIFQHFDAISGDGHVTFEARIKTLSRLLRTGVLERSEDGSFSMSPAARTQYEERASA